MDSPFTGACGMVFVACIFFLLMSILVIFIACRPIIFQKAGRNPWTALIPFYSDYVLCDIALGIEWLSLIYCLAPLAFCSKASASIVPLAKLVMNTILSLNLAKKFGKSTGFAVGLILLPIVFYPILAFGKSEYIPNAGEKNQDQEIYDEQSYSDDNKTNDEILNDDYSLDNEINSDKDGNQQNKKSKNDQ